MGNDNRNEHSYPAQDPDQAGKLNLMIAAAVQEAVKSTIAALAPTLMANSDPARLATALREANRPWVDPLKEARDKRESLKSKQDEEELRKLERARRDACTHTDANGRPSICLVHNFPDHQPRGTCVICGDWIFPKEWRYAPPDDKNPKGRPYLVEPHKDYRVVMQLESRS